jgi:hypothetical protein
MLQRSGILEKLFKRSFFERIIIYCFLSELFVKIVYELCLGVWWFSLSPVKQIILYLLFAVDYAFNFRKLIHIRFWSNPVFYFMLLVCVMVAQGLFVGIYNHNQPFEIFNDSFPLVLMAVNALRLQSPIENKWEIDFEFLIRFCSWMSVAICVIGFIAKSILGLLSTPAISGVIAGVYFVLMIAALLTGYRIRFIYWLCFILVLFFSASDFNRTTLAFMLLMIGAIFFKFSIYKPFMALLFMAATLTLGFGLWNFLPEDSKTKGRITDLTQASAESRTGSVGERLSEWHAIQEKVAQNGTTARWIGLGHGALYDVRYTVRVIKDYGFAHFAWALFYLRYGLSGYVYLFFLTAILLWQLVRYWSFSAPLSMSISLLSLFSLLYLATYVNFVILCMGLQFLVLNRSDGVVRKTDQENKTINPTSSNLLFTRK